MTNDTRPKHGKDFRCHEQTRKRKKCTKGDQREESREDRTLTGTREATVTGRDGVEDNQRDSDECNNIYQGHNLRGGQRTKSRTEE